MSGRVTFGNLASGGGVGGGEGPFRILLMGDFSGRAQRLPVQRLAGRKRTLLDVDNWEQTLAELGTEIHVALGGAGGAEIVIRPKELEDFHPDQLYDKLEVFQALRSLRKRLADTATFPAAAEEVRSWAAQAAPAGADAAGDDQPSATPAATAPASAGAATEAPEEMLGRLLGARPARQGAPAGPKGAAAGIDAIIRSVVAPHIVPATDRQQPALLARVDEALADQMRAVLHHPQFQAVEAVWRGVHFLVTHLETDEDLQLHVMDVTKDELAADLSTGEDLRATDLYKLLVIPTVGSQGGKPWAVLAAAFTFDKTPADAAVLGRLAKIARAAGSPLVAAASDRVAGCQSIAASPDPDDWHYQSPADAQAAWDDLRKLPEATYLALGLPRMLLRLPYGRATDACERFDFEEFVPGYGHECYLWGSPAFALAAVLGADFSNSGWEMAAELYHDIDSLPMHVYTEDGDRQVKPCAEAYLSDRAAMKLQDQGLAALLSVQGRDIIRLRGVPALANPVRALSGRWTG
jgi:type VI secretion system protein ImpC